MFFLTYILFSFLAVVLFGFLYKIIIKPKLNKFLSKTANNGELMNIPPWEKIIVGEENIIFDEYFSFVSKEGKLLSVIIDQSETSKELFPITRALVSNVPRIVSARIDPIAKGESTLLHETNDNDTTTYVIIIEGSSNIKINDGKSGEIKKGHVFLANWKNNTKLTTSENTILLTLETKNRILNF